MTDPGFRVVYHWWPDCTVWPVDETDDDVIHRVAGSPDQVTCEQCRADPDVRPPRE